MSHACFTFWLMCAHVRLHVHVSLVSQHVYTDRHAHIYVYTSRNSFNTLRFLSPKIELEKKKKKVVN